MDILTHFFGRVKSGVTPQVGGGFLSRIRGAGVLVGAYGIGALFFGVLIFDGIVFYTTVARRHQDVPATARPLFSEQDIIDTKKIADDRQKNLDSLLGATK